MALNTVSSDRLATNVKTSNLGSELSKKVGQSKNLVINGAMNVAQRSVSSTAGGYQTVDRMPVYHTGGAVTQSQGSLTSGSPFENGFTKYLRLTNTTANTGTDVARSLIYKIESQDVANSGWNYKSSSSYITISFWVRSSISQQFYIMARTQDGTSQAYPFSLGTLSANTWTKVTHSIPGNSNLQFDTDTYANATDRGLEFFLYVSLGTDFTSSSVTLNAWGAYTSSARLPDYTNSWAAATNATFDITGYQIEVGSVATDFEHRSFTKELALCQRYCYVINMDLGNYSGFQGQALSDANAQVINYFPTPMRTEPTYTGSATLCRFQSQNSSVSVNFNALSIHRTPQQRPVSVIGLQDDDVGSMSGGQSVLLMAMADSGKMTFEAEL